MLKKVDPRRSKYYQKHKKLLSCPYCGWEMMLYYSYSYDSTFAYWQCPKCGLEVPDLSDFDRAKLRKDYRKYLKLRIRDLRFKLDLFKKRLHMYAKFFKDEKEVARAVIEELESNRSN